MKRRPYPLSVMMLGHWLLACAIVLVFGHALATGILVWDEVGSSKALLISTLVLASVVGGVFAAMGSRWLLWSALVSIAASSIVTANLDDWPLEIQGQLGLCALVAGFLHLLLFWPSSRAVLVHPSRRWWLQAKRRSLSYPVRLNAGDASLDLVAFDASETGIFLQMQPKADTPARLLASLVERDDPVELVVDVGLAGEEICLGAEVSRLQLKAEGGYPPGLGLRFVSRHGPSYQRFRALLQRLPSRERHTS